MKIITVLAISLSFAFLACGGDDSSDGGDTIDINDFVGTWKVLEVKSQETTCPDEEHGENHLVIELTEDTKSIALKWCPVGSPEMCSPFDNAKSFVDGVVSFDMEVSNSNPESDCASRYYSVFTLGLSDGNIDYSGKSGYEFTGAECEDEMAGSGSTEKSCEVDAVIIWEKI